MYEMTPSNRCLFVCYTFYYYTFLAAHFMEQNIFSPKLQSTVEHTEDNLSNMLRSWAIGILTAVFGLLPILFVPGVYVALGFTKTALVVAALFIASVSLSLSVLRSGVFRIYMPLALAFFWGVAMVSVVSAFLSGDKSDSLAGTAFEIGTAGFLVLLALVMTFAMTFCNSKSAISRVFLMLGGSVFVLQVYHLLRIIFGADFMSFGLFTAVTDSPFGSFNDLAILSGGALLIVLVVAQYISGSWLSKLALSIYTATSLLLLAVINFYSIWMILGFVSLLLVLYLVSNDTWLRSSAATSAKAPQFALLLVGVVCVVSGVFVMSGDYISSRIGQVTNISYLEVRPSVDTTLNIARATWRENALLGVGPNRFEDAWRTHKDPVINESLFWSTNFTAGNGYVTTLFVTTGILGLVMLVCFFGAFLYLGYRALILSEFKEGGWYLVGLVSFVASLYLWFMAIIYVPGAATLFLTAFTTGLTFAAYIASKPERGLKLNVAESRQYGLFLIAAVLVVIITSVLSVINFGKQYLAGATYAEAAREYQISNDYTKADNLLAKSFSLHSQDLFVAERSQLRLIAVQELSTEENTTLNQQKFTSLISEGIALAEQAINLDPTNPNNYRLLIGYYTLLDPKEFTDVKDRTMEVFKRMRELDATNPLYLVEQAQYQATYGDGVAARASLTDAIKLKNNYTDAMYLMTKLDIAEGKVDDAVALTSAIISIEPRNPARYFQLGVLLASNKKINEAVGAFETAVTLDNNYANARYLLALAYLEQERKDDALIQLNIIKESNPENEELKALIGQVEGGNYKKSATDSTENIENTTTVSQEGDVTTATENPDTDLVTPINRTTDTPEGTSESETE
jgi:tetratricopeptide (TPR) repeat protein